ncbi:MAG: DUF624 domain-containing protein [Lachnospiraceae bacterium]|nr:DUF624 domain-containing protein [Lachnospiraceae bacterium]
MNGIFQLDSPLWRFLNTCTDVILLSLLWIVTSLPLITLGPALIALYEQMYLISENHEGHIISGYWKSFQKACKEWLVVFLAGILLGLVLVGDWYILIVGKMPYGAFLLPVVVVLSITYLVVFLYVVALGATCEAPKKQIFLLALTMPVKEWLRTLFMLFIVIIMGMVGVLVYAPFLAVAPGVIALSHIYLFREIFKKYHMQVVEEHVEF